MGIGRRLLRWVAFFAFLHSSSCFAYKDGVHFYVTYILGYWCGLDRIPYADGTTEAYSIAWANYTTDNTDETEPGVMPTEWLNFSKLETRRRFHFPAKEYTIRVVRASPSAYTNLNLALKSAQPNSGNQELLGIALHTLQDSWAHEGYDADFGHIWTTEPDFPQYDVNKAMEMAEATYHGLDQWSQKVHGKKCEAQFNNVEPILRTWFEFDAADTESLNDEWQKNVAATVGKSVPLGSFGDNQDWLRRFLKAAQLLQK